MNEFAALFISDLALEVRSELADRLAVGVSIADATAHALMRFRDLLNDPDEGPVVFLSIAAMQLDHGAVQPEIRDAAIDLIDSGEAERAWKTADSAARRQRRDLLAQLADALRTAPADDGQ